MDRLADGDTLSGGAIVIPAIAADGSLYPVEKLAAHRAGLLHLAVSVFVFSREGELLIQRRAAGKYHSGGLWANSCCSHPNWGEDIAASAQRRLTEELGFSSELTPAGRLDYRAPVSGGLTEWERVQAFRAEVDRTTLTLALDPAEVSDVRWAQPRQLMVEAAATPDRFAPWFRIYLERWDELAL